ncbi:dihydrodipicolinate synthase family protein [Actinoallomurus acaciae]|uniref:Dihydrodipicolinate synthase family protein n=1 Tax=Actinoallomurus acaciae TaxID=502577 RepID=A0ABV5YE24_9ACTN
MTIHGAISAIVTPFTADAAAVDERALRDLVDRTVAAGADGIIACGGTGEFTALSTEERHEVVRIVTEQTAGRIPVIAQTGGLSTREAIAHADHAASAGADALMVAPPFYEPLSTAQAEEYFGDVATATELPIMLYNYPRGTGLAMDAELIVSLAGQHGNIRFVKDSSADAFLLSRLVSEYGDRVGTFCGEDVLVGAALTIGALGLVTGSFNFMMPVHATMLQAARAGDHATVSRLWRETLPLVVCLASNPYTSAVKTACSILGHDVGPVRAPLPAISARGREELQARIAALDPAYFG